MRKSSRVSVSSRSSNEMVRCIAADDMDASDGGLEGQSGPLQLGHRCFMMFCQVPRIHVLGDPI